MLVDKPNSWLPQSHSWVLWNLMLAVIPVALGYLLAEGAGRFTLRQKRVPWLLWLPLGIAWFAFLPNTCYLLTEWRHYLLDGYYVSLRDNVNDNPDQMLTIARQGLFFAMYSGVGALCFALSIRPVHHLLRRTRLTVALWAIPFFFLISLGVYMGLIVRLNSWNIVTHPLKVFQAALHVVNTPILFTTVVVFAGILWLLYMIVDMWVDGAKMRFQRLGATTKKQRSAAA